MLSTPYSLKRISALLISASPSYSYENGPIDVALASKLFSTSSLTVRRSKALFCTLTEPTCAGEVGYDLYTSQSRLEEHISGRDAPGRC